MNKTISQIAAEIGVSRQSVWHKTKNKQFAEQIKKHSKVIGNKLYIDKEGKKIIKNAFTQLINERQQNPKHHDNKTIDKLEKNIADNTIDENNYSNKQIIDMLNSQIVNLNKQNEELRQDNKELAEELRAERKHLRELADKLAELATNAQKLHAGDIVAPKLEATVETDNTKKNSIFDILFRRKNNK